jgi:NitT/TauT family transport system substrate-binding protein
MSERQQATFRHFWRTRARESAIGVRLGFRGIWCLAVVFTVFYVPAQAQEKIRLSISSLDTAFLTTAVALKKGFFEKEGLEAELIRMNANVAMAALSSGDVDYSMIFGSVVRAALQGLPVRVLAGSINRATHTLVARPQFGSVKDLKGRTLGVSSFGAAADVVGRMMIRHFGLDPDRDMKILALGGDRARFAALKEGVVDATIVSPPADVEATRLGYNTLARASELFNFPIVGVSATIKKISEKPDEVKKVIKSLIRANRYIHEDRTGTIEVLAQWSRTERALAAAAYDATWKVYSLDGSIPEDGLRLVIDAAKKGAKVTRDIKIEDVANFAPLRQAQRELGIGR